MKNNSSTYIDSCSDFNLFKKLLIEHFPNFNLDNTKYLDEIFHLMSNIKIKGKVSFIKECSKIFKSKRNGKGVSKISKNYWISLGWSEDDAISKVSRLQSIRSFLTEDYWTNKGYSIKESKDKIKEIQSNNSKKRYNKYTKAELTEQSVWSKSYWINRGLSDGAAELEVNKRNYGKREFWKSDAEYEEIKKIIGNKTSKFIKENPEKYKSFFGSISKEEIKFFNHIKEDISDINHEQFIINVKKSDELNQGLVKYDGYIHTDHGIILIEYDGLYWHNQSYDEIKDRLSLELRPDIIGVIRISCVHYKTNPKKTIKKIKDAINKIKSKEGNRIKIY